MRRSWRVLMTLVLVAATSGCLATLVETPTKAGKQISTTTIHLLAAPGRIDAHVCTKGVARSSTFVPLWGVAAGFFTFGIVVPKTTIYSCVEG